MRQQGRNDQSSNQRQRAWAANRSGNSNSSEIWLSSAMAHQSVRVRFHIIRHTRIKNVVKYQSCMLSTLQIIWKQTVALSRMMRFVERYSALISVHLSYRSTECGEVHTSPVADTSAAASGLLGSSLPSVGFWRCGSLNSSASSFAAE